MDEADDTDVQVTIVCQGLPYCDLRGDKAQRAQEGGCIWCARVYTEIDEDGKVVREYIDQPGTA